MKKLMFATLAATAVGSVFAQPLAYDYKASVKHMYLQLKEDVKTYKTDRKYDLYLKVQKSASLKGYLIMDQDGVTSPTIAGAAQTATAFDYGRSRGFLVVQNSSADKKLRFPKIIPAVLDAKYIDTAVSKKDKPSSGLAEGYLYLGGDAVAPVRPQLDILGNADTQRAAIPPLPVAAQTAGMVAIADYAWTSIFLFGGQFNGPNYYNDPNATTAPFAAFETAWDANLPAALRRIVLDNTGAQVYANYGDWYADWQAGNYAECPTYFHDTWMNGSGFGKYTVPEKTGKLCCGIKKISAKVLLDTLSGSVKGGLFLCTENAIDADVQDAGYEYTYRFFDQDNYRWEDQFNTQRLVGGANMFTLPDSWQNDLWQDGFFEIETTDVITGSWSIKYNTKFFGEKDPVYKPITPGIVDALTGANQLQGYVARTTVSAQVTSLDILCGALYGAAYKLNSKVNFADGTEIHTMNATRFSNVLSGADKLPMITPQFATYYGLNLFN